jgi:sarcosine oxidase subunit gamma
MADEAASSAPALPETPHEGPRGDFRIVARPAGHVLQILAPPFADGTASRVGELSDGDAHALRCAGPGTWYLVGDAPLAPEDIAEREARLGPRTRIVDQTHGRFRLEISGPGAARVLATGTAVDLSLARFPIGSACETQFGHIGIHITRTGADRFELLVGRSFATSLWEELTSRPGRIPRAQNGAIRS